MEDDWNRSESEGEGIKGILDMVKNQPVGRMQVPGRAGLTANRSDCYPADNPHPK